MTRILRMVCGLGLAAALSLAARAGSPQVKTGTGPLVGASSGGMVSFLGIPYAAPPLGALRWMPPAPPRPWSAPRKATAFGPSCAQITTLGPFAGPANDNEDCLFLNVFAPAASAKTGAKKLPVLFWIHGGGHIDGRSNDYDPSLLVKQGLVVVTINYRLGLFGFLAHPALDKEGHLFGNYATLDQQAALHWVHDNIAAFGGDPGNVTVAGQSAGASDASAQVLSPLAKGLIARAIFESGGYNALIPLAVAEDKGAKFAAAAGCKGEGAAQCLRKLPVQKILALSGTASATGPFTSGPMLDGRIFPEPAHQAFRKGHFNPVPVMNGMVKDEGNFNIGITEYFSGPPRAAVTAKDFAAYVAKIYGGNAGAGGGPPAYPKGTVDAVMAHYPLKNYATAQLAQDAVMTDPITCRSRHTAMILSTRVPVYDYEFDEETAPTYFPDMPGYKSLAYHTADLQFLFAGYHGGPKGIAHALNPAQQRLSGQMVAAWVNFARSGNPNGGGNAPWPRLAGEKGHYLSQNIPALSTLTDATFAARHQCGFWDRILLY